MYKCSCGSYHSFKFCPFCGMDSQPNTTYKLYNEPVYEEKGGELTNQKYEIAIQILTKRTDDLEKKLEELPKLFKKMSGEIFDEGWKMAKVSKRSNGKSSPRKNSVSPREATKGSVEGMGESE